MLIVVVGELLLSGCACASVFIVFSIISGNVPFCFMFSVFFALQTACGTVIDVEQRRLTHP